MSNQEITDADRLAYSLGDSSREVRCRTSRLVTLRRGGICEFHMRRHYIPAGTRVRREKAYVEFRSGWDQYNVCLECLDAAIRENQSRALCGAVLEER